MLDNNKLQDYLCSSKKTNTKEESKRMSKQKNLNMDKTNELLSKRKKERERSHFERKI